MGGVRFAVYEQTIVKWSEGGRPLFRVSMMIGNIIHNLRSTLDHLVCALAKRSNPDCSRTAFPVYSDAGEYAKRDSRTTQGVPADAIEMIDRLQPFNTVRCGEKAATQRGIA